MSHGLKVVHVAVLFCSAMAIQGCDSITAHYLENDLRKHLVTCSGKNTVDCTNEAIDLTITTLELTSNSLDAIADMFDRQGLPEEFSEAFVERYNEVIEEKSDELEGNRPWLFNRWFRGDSKPSEKVVFDMVAIQNDFTRVTPAILQDLVDERVIPDEYRIMILKMYISSMNLPKEIRDEFERAINPAAHTAKSFFQGLE